ncbi:hypothetical protein J8I88_06920 [Duffyella gerundensis]|uniref:hypothetical protein n=1 Tax=Duffyella gerundensis TaxID=1619313 RepID=UPI001AE42FAC|nr:hypothetical protein [Duffyella gerundensis]QTO55579.1 hypothetical protein J8I88_06920 [Duffyella gerundensis]
MSTVLHIRILIMHAVILLTDTIGQSWRKGEVDKLADEPGTEFDFSKLQHRKERQKLLSRICSKEPATRKKTSLPTINEAGENLKTTVLDISRMRLSAGEVKRMMRGHGVKIGGQTYWSGSRGLLYRGKPIKPSPLDRFQALAAQHSTAKPAQQISVQTNPNHTIVYDC